MSDMAGPDGIREITADEAIAYWRQQAQLQAKRAGKAEAELATLRAEVERLRACLKKDPKTLLIAYEDGRHGELAEALCKAQDEIERLRAALRDIATLRGLAADLQARARATLGQEKPNE